MPNAFYEQRQAALQAGPLNTELWGELVEMDADGSRKSIRVKIAHAAVNDAQGRLVGATGVFPKGGTQDESERIRVTVSRDPRNADAVVNTPFVGHTLKRSQARDADRRPYSFKGEIEHQEEHFAVYIYERPRRATQGVRG